MHSTIRPLPLLLLIPSLIITLVSATPIPFLLRQTAASLRSPSPTACPIRLPQEPPISRQLAPHIVGGAPSSKRTASYLVALYKFGFFACTGTLISSRWVLTAAHCYLNSNSVAFLVSLRGSAGVNVSIAAVFIPSQTNNTFPGPFPRDVALLKLAEDAPAKATYAKVNGDLTLPVVRSFARTVGYGRIAYEVSNPGNRLRQVDVPIADWEDCKETYPADLTEDRICAGYPYGKCDSCQGDSGGPLLQFDGDDHPVVVGVVSAGFECAVPSYPGIYMRISSYVEWMRTVGADFEVAGSVEQVMDSSTQLPSPSFSVLPSSSPIPSQHVCPVVLPRHPPVGITERIAGGLPASSTTAQYIAAIHHPFGYRCTGVLISKRWVITAAHCQVDTSFTVKLSGLDSNSGIEASIEKVYYRNQTNRGTSNENEFKYAAIRLMEDATSSIFAVLNKDIALPYPDSFARVVGYGNILGGQNSGQRLRQVDVPIVSLESCKDEYEGLTYDKICAGYETGGCNPCFGDEGGPLIQFDEDGIPVVIGITLTGIACIDNGTPALYVRTSLLLDWLADIGAEFQSSDQAVQLASDGSAVTKPSPRPILSCPPILKEELPVVRTSGVRVVGGNASPEIAARYMASLWSPFGFRCSGVLVSSNWILTAEKCPVGSSWTATTGQSMSSREERALDIAEVLTSILGQFSLVRLETPSSTSQPPASAFAKLNTNLSIPVVGAFVRIMGYGTNSPSESEEMERKLHQVDVPVAERSGCPVFGNGKDSVCAGYDDRECTTCSGDTGGPLIQFDAAGDPVVVGLVSQDNGCRTVQGIAVFVRASSFVEIMKNLGAVFETSNSAKQVFRRETEIDEEAPDGVGEFIPENGLKVIYLVGIVGGVILTNVILFFICFRIRFKIKGTDP